MFFYASKLISGLIWPSSVITLLLVAGSILLLLGRWPLWSRRLLLTGVALLIACGLSPLGNWLVLPLEQRFQRGELPGRIAGVIILGGFETAKISMARNQLSLNESAERLTEGVLVALSRPEAKVVFTGGDGSMFRTMGSAAGPVGAYFQAIGISPGRIVLEDRSRTTHENALFLLPLLEPRPGDRYVLVTSAYHMPRSVGTFRHAGFDVVPWPVDYRTRGSRDRWTYFVNIQSGLERVDFSFKEWLGLVAYWFTGRTAELWPGPDNRPAGHLPKAAPAPSSAAPTR